MIRLFIKEKRRVLARPGAAQRGGRGGPGAGGPRAGGRTNNIVDGSAVSTCGAAAPLSVRVCVMLYLSTFTIENTASKFQLPT